jgi:hypothetical protein
MKIFLLITVGLWLTPLQAQVTLNTIRNAAANTWIAVPNTRMDALDPCPARNCSYSAIEGISAVMNDWCGGAYDSKRDRLVVWGGGHGGYYGNELYAFDVPTLTWLRLNQPSTSLGLCTDVNPDGTPNSRHTYGGLTYIDKTDQFFGKGGAAACPGGNGGCTGTWLYNFVANHWNNPNPTGNTGTYWGDEAAYDAKSGKVWFMAGSSSSSSVWGLWSFNVTANTWTKHNSDAAVNGGMAVDTSRNILFAVTDSKLLVYNISTGTPVKVTWTTTGDQGLITSKSSGVGLDYDPVADRLVGWHGGAVYTFDPATKVWTAYTASGAPAQNSNGTYGRWHYSPLVNAFVVANFTDQNVYFYKLTSGTGVESRPLSRSAGLLQASPNPFRSAVTLYFPGAQGGASLRVFSATGKLVAAFETLKTGAITWNAGNMPAGVYLAELKAGGKAFTKRVVLAR